MTSVDWFDEFVRVTVTAWARKQRLAARAQPNPSPAAIGAAGEKYLAKRLHALGYWAGISPGSRSPADVWAIRKLRGGVFHLPLIQVKTSERGGPQALTDAERDDLETFAGFVHDRFRSHFDDATSVVVSTWDAGIVSRSRNPLRRWDAVNHAWTLDIDAAKAQRVVRAFDAKVRGA